MLHKRQNRRGNKGFTLMETLAALAILVILTGIVIVPVASMTNSLKMTELDSTAKTIYQAMQNRLVSDKAAGTLVELQAQVATLDQKVTEKPSDYSSEDKNWESLFYVTSSQAEIVGTLMRAAAISSSLVSGGSYIVELDPRSGEVYGVFYSEKQNLTYDDVLAVCKDSRSRDARSAAALGYYGGFSTSLSPDDLPEHFEPTITVVNKEELYINIHCPDITAALASQENLKVKVTITDESNTAKEFELIGKRDFDLATSQDIQMILDSTRTGALPDDSVGQLSFANITGLNAGDNISIAADIIYEGNGRYIDSQPTATASTNSLFGSVTRDDGTSSTRIAVSSVRHLNNLRQSVYELPEEKRTATTTIVQTADIDFDANNWYYADGEIDKNAISAISYSNNGNSVINPIESFAPIANNLLLNTKNVNSGSNAASIQGDSEEEYTISNFYITGEGNGGTGLFAATDGELSNIHIENTTVEGGDNVGALSGIHCGGAVTNCTVIDPKVMGASNVGGLFGACKSTEISGCSVRLDDIDRRTINDRVRNHTVNAAGGYVGGLIGNVIANDSRDEGTKIKDSFAAINVNAGEGSSYAAGFVGYLDTASSPLGWGLDLSTIENCYSSGDVSGDRFVAGFAGYLGQMGTAKSCYTTSNVTGSWQVAGFLADYYGYFAITYYTGVWDSYSYGLVDDGLGSRNTYGFSRGWPSLTRCGFLNQRGYNDTSEFQMAAKSYGALFKSDQIGNDQILNNQISNSHPYSDTLYHHLTDGYEDPKEKYAFPFSMCRTTEGQIMPHYGNWPEFVAMEYDVADGFTGSFSIAQNDQTKYYVTVPYAAKYGIDAGVFLKESGANGANYYPVKLTMQDDSSGEYGRGAVLSKVSNKGTNGYTTSPSDDRNQTVSAIDHSFDSGTELTIKVEPATYDVEWIDGDGNRLKVESVYYGSVAGEYGTVDAKTVPTKTAEVTMLWDSYVFKGDWEDAGLSVQGDMLTQTMRAQFKQLAWEQQMLDMISYGKEGNPSLWSSEWSSTYRRRGYIYSNLNGRTIGSNGINVNSQAATLSTSAALWNANYLAATYGISAGVESGITSYQLYINGGTIVKPSDDSKTDVKSYPRLTSGGYTDIGQKYNNPLFDGNYRLYWGDKVDKVEAGEEAKIIVYDLGRAAHGERAWHKATVKVISNGTVLIYDVENTLDLHEGDPDNWAWYDYQEVKD